ncbi:hypothetical protein [Bacillus sp. NPDC094106]|uniref:hypothetical protein n=1 Tax=Bacillus sp. NPDC094106 TaxID=3363949 RepID=UPI00380E1F74
MWKLSLGINIFIILPNKKGIYFGFLFLLPLLKGKKVAVILFLFWYPKEEVIDGCRFISEVVSMKLFFGEYVAKPKEPRIIFLILGSFGLADFKIALFIMMNDKVFQCMKGIFV